MGCLWGGGYCSSAHVLQSTTAAAFVFSSLANAYYLCATQKTLVCAFILLYSIQLQPKPMAKVWRRTSWYSIYILQRGSCAPSQANVAGIGDARFPSSASHYLIKY